MTPEEPARRRAWRRGMRRIASRLLAVILAVYVLLMVMTCHLQNRILYPGAFDGSAAGERPDVSAQGGEWLARELEQGGEVEALFFEARGAEAGRRDTPQPLVVYWHGNGDRVEWTGLQIQVWRELGYHVLVPEYRGYGRSRGEPGAAAGVEDVAWFIDEVARGHEGVDARRLIFHGYSLGGAAAGEFARTRAPRMMVLRSTFSSMSSMAHRRYMPGFLARDGYDTAQVVAQGDFPVLVTHGSRDEVIPVGESVKIEEAGGARVTHEVFACGHSMCPPEAEYATRVRKWHDAHRERLSAP